MNKERIQQIVDSLPNEVDVDAFVEKPYLLSKIEAAEEQISRCEGVSHEDAKKRLDL